VIGVTAWLTMYLQTVVKGLPAYAPDLNPVTLVWNRSEYGDLYNSAPNNLAILEVIVFGVLSETRGDHTLVAFVVPRGGVEPANIALRGQSSIGKRHRPVWLADQSLHLSKRRTRPRVYRNG
jgi:hypothetical protein